MDTLTTFSLSLVPVIDALNTTNFAQALALCVKEWVSADDVTLLLYREDELPNVAYTLPPEAGVAATLDVYLTGPFLLDPFYRAAAVHQRYGAFRLKELAPKGFTSSEYYHGWYRNCGFSDEAGLLVQLEDGFLNLALGLTDNISPGRSFDDQAMARLRATYPTIAALARQHWRQARASGVQTPLREQLHASLASFGASLLTPRERQVTEMVLLGNSTRVIAEKLQISTETVKLHRKHAYAKLDVSSQAELFILFMEALAFSPDGGSTDPLIAYHSKPQIQ